MGLQADNLGRLVHFGSGAHIARSGRVNSDLLQGADCVMFTKRTVLLIEPFRRSELDLSEYEGMQKHLLSLVDMEKASGRNRPVYCIGVSKEINYEGMRRVRTNILGNWLMNHEDALMRDFLTLPARVASTVTAAVEKSEHIDESRQAWIEGALELARDPNVATEFWIAWLEQSAAIIAQNPKVGSEGIKKLLMTFQPCTPDGKAISRGQTVSMESL